MILDQGDDLVCELRISQHQFLVNTIFLRVMKMRRIIDAVFERQGYQFEIRVLSIGVEFLNFRLKKVEQET